MEIISGVERRRRWSDEAKLGILSEAEKDYPVDRLEDLLPWNMPPAASMLQEAEWWLVRCTSTQSKTSLL
ncbi:hypothetical protein FHT86_001385 [Rhizobium sp. BK313]|uniref:hypothetical protein n=1 Tax=Rhizobium sp. BK313 TaxID=2587081 RepID=UPI0014150F15|nr:hypothetical protein [Rhizobium sp. BK313]MBB3453129.1 hypothetical protein [Rhizobium sp. BK313]